jgi:membrane protein involved in D-alanine export
VIPFATPLYFGLIGYAAAPTLVLGVLGRLRGGWMLAVSLAMLAVQLGWVGELVAASACLALQLSVAIGFAGARARKLPFPTWLAVGLVIAPVVLARLHGLALFTTPVGFLGLSYVTFRVLDVVLGVHDGSIKQLDIPATLAFVLFFPTFTSGPIDRYRRFVADYRKPLDRATYLEMIDAAVPLMIRGLFYKFVVAAWVQTRFLADAGGSLDARGLVVYMYAYSAFLFFDFAGYSAMAMAVSKLFGINTPPNFNKPFLAPNIVEFWNRWHMSLSAWFRDHIYMRFVLASKRRKWFADRFLPSYIGLILSFGLMGLWHGFTLHFVAYGLYHAMLQIGHSLFTRWNTTRHWWGDTMGWRIAGIVLTAHAFFFSLLIFSGKLF